VIVFNSFANFACLRACLSAVQAVQAGADGACEKNNGSTELAEDCEPLARPGFPVSLRRNSGHNIQCDCTGMRIKSRQGRLEPVNLSSYREA